MLKDVIVHEFVKHLGFIEREKTMLTHGRKGKGGRKGRFQHQKRLTKKSDLTIYLTNSGHNCGMPGIDQNITHI